MLDIKFIRQNSDIVKKAAQDKLIEVDIDKLLSLDENIRMKNQELDNFKEERNRLSSSIPTLKDDEKRNTIMYVKNLKDKISNLEEELKPIKEEFNGKN